MLGELEAAHCGGNTGRRQGHCSIWEPHHEGLAPRCADHLESSAKCGSVLDGEYHVNGCSLERSLKCRSLGELSDPSCSNTMLQITGVIFFLNRNNLSESRLIGTCK